MVSLNLTVVIELALFLFFYLVSRKLVFAPLHRVVLERQARMRNDEGLAQQDQAEAERLERLEADRVVTMQQQAVQRLREARFRAYQQNRIEADERRLNADLEVKAFHERVQAQLERERQRYGEYLPGIMETIDRQVNIEGSLM